MGKKIIKLVFLILVFIGIGSGIFINIRRENNKKEEQERIVELFTSTQTKNVILTNFYTYGNTLNIEGKISNISKDNFEGAKLILTDGITEKTISLDTKIEDKDLIFSTSLINNSIELDELELGNYYILFRLKLNNSSVPKLYFLSPKSELSGIEYYTVSKNGENRKINIEMLEREIDSKTYKYLSVKVMNDKLPEDIYDIVIDSGHGGKDERRTFRKIYRS